VTLEGLITDSVGPPVAIFLPRGRHGGRLMVFADDRGTSVIAIRHQDPALYVQGLIGGLFLHRLRNRLRPDD
jgi:hypothetical protein